MVADGYFGAADSDWHKRLKIAVIAGCSVLDVTGHKWQSNPTEVNKAPGRNWAATGPWFLLGYEGAAPIDRFWHKGIPPYSTDGAPRQVVQLWIERMEIYIESPIYAWLYANWWYAGGGNGVDKNCHNACAIDAHSNPKRAYHLIGNRFGSFLSNFQEVPESQWAGQ